MEMLFPDEMSDPATALLIEHSFRAGACVAAAVQSGGEAALRRPALKRCGPVSALTRRIRSRSASTGSRSRSGSARSSTRSVTSRSRSRSERV